MTDSPGSGAPEIVTRPEQPYMGIREQVPMAEIARFAGRFGELFAWLGSHGLTPAGPPFFRYNVVDMDRELDMEAGVPVRATPDSDGPDGDGPDGDGPAGDVAKGVLPGGRYAAVTHIGHPQELMLATKELLDWGAAQGLKWDTSSGPQGEQWGCRLEIYLTDPGQEPDMSKWETQLAFRLSD
jgi:effector-binding domain-containing protein